MTYWLDTSTPSPYWLLIEQEDCQHYSLGIILLSPTTTNNTLLYNDNVKIQNILRIWKQMKSHFKLPPIS